MNLTVQIDSREQGRIETAKKYYEKLDITVEVAELPIGDYIFTDGNDSVVYEFKTCEDYIASIHDGRLPNEAINQAEEFNHHFIVIYGSLYDRTQAIIKSRDYIPITIEQYIASISSLNRYTTVLQVYNNVIEEAYYTMQKQAEKCLSQKPIVRKFPRKHRNPAFNYLCYCIHGISSKKAKAITETYDLHSLTDLMTLTLTDLQKIEGIGENTAKKILTAIHGEQP